MFFLMQASGLAPGEPALLLPYLEHFFFNYIEIVNMVWREGNTWKCVYQVESVLILPYCQQHVKCSSQRKLVTASILLNTEW